jgi:hypothetical protein
VVLVSWFGAAWHWYSVNATVINPIGKFLGALGAFVTAATLAWVGIKNARTAALRHEEQTKADRERRITESFSKATEQLASDKVEARLGGIYTLERISRERRDDYWVVMETLTAFVRERARWKERDKIALETLMSPCDDENSEDKLQPATDIAAVLTVIHRRHLQVGWRKNLDRAIHWNFRGTDLRRASLISTHLEGADFMEAHLEGAILVEAHLEGANFMEAHLEGASLEEAHLEGAKLLGTHLGGAILMGTHLEGVDLGTVKGLTLDQVTQALGNSETILPRGLTPPEHWRRVS